MVQRLGEDILSHCAPLAHGKFSVDLKGIIHWQLTQAGLADGHVPVHRLPPGALLVPPEDG